MDIKEKIIEILMATERAGMEDLIAEMDRMGFFTAPCSSQYHLCKEGGLAEHSLNVYFNMLSICLAFNTDIDVDSVAICGILHDLGKAGDYGKPNYVPNVLKNGKVSDTKPYETNKELLYIPHEVRSIAIAQRYIKLTEEEEHAIYYHNGKYTHIGNDLKETPLMLVLHFADLWSSRVTEKKEEE